MVQKLSSEGENEDSILKRNHAEALNFPHTEKQHRCLSCPFKALCESTNFENLNEEKLRESVPSIKNIRCHKNFKPII